MKLYYSPGACALSPHIVLHESGLPFDAVPTPTKTKKLPDGNYLLDFNAAYNPACAFSEHYNCPIPPKGNTLPVAIRVNGTYHDIGRFVSDLAQLPRIVTLHDMVLTPAKDGVLNMDARIQTYRYLDENELAAARARKGPR